jgi:hypothetical protein
MICFAPILALRNDSRDLAHVTVIRCVRRDTWHMLCYCYDMLCFAFASLCYDLLCTNPGIAERQQRPGTCNGESMCSKGHLAHAVLLL